MKIIFVKLLLSLAIGLATGEIAGVSTKVTKYYILNRENVSHQVDEVRYHGHLEGGSSPFTKKEFNKGNFYFYGILTFSGVLIILLIPEFKKKKIDISELRS